ncbi:tRNA-2-methylthio-n(6)-dimethylallyladenosine synthase [Plakobranchus ocellatus]|uniref:tRNA-2-methylthio-n(6)-dimethylallyladenosine synthase n=1 Tax=Plakobranchus ocellatus TaxID=259542 RepID=A0AAV3YA91_9GAST|nr:tRNA-2-methylthio-n(6)-dimethylallyladenosine synthase [Plakobranchus ocellatus]
MKVLCCSFRLYPYIHVFNKFESAVLTKSVQFTTCVDTFNEAASQTVQKRPDKIKAQNHTFSGPSLADFIQRAHDQGQNTSNNIQDDSYLGAHLFQGNNRSVFIETYGCQMNVNDTEIVQSILEQNGFVKSPTLEKADVVLAMTCAIREGAEEKIWRRLHHFKGMKKRRGKRSPLQIGLLGCMAERLKHKIIDKEKLVDVVCGPDAYRDLPRLLTVTSSTKQSAVNVQLSLEETYADVVPVRINSDSPSAFVSIMRGCDNMCTYCIVPFTRGRERSRALASILNEINVLTEQGCKEVTLLGQNVNSYRDLSSEEHAGSPTQLSAGQNVNSYRDLSSEEHAGSPTQLSAGFSTVYKPKTGGRRFAELLEAVARVNPEMRVRFTSPHPKDFPDEVLDTIIAYPNICKQIHLPAQSGNSQVLASMGRGYTRETYLDLVDHIRKVIPDVALSSDFIAGFCGETEEAHRDTLSLMDIVKYNFAFCFPYSMRQKTRAYHRLEDDVPKDVKMRRHDELHAAFRKYAEARHLSQVGERHLILVEGKSKRSSLDLAGRNDANTKTVFANIPLPFGNEKGSDKSVAKPGDYVVVELTTGNSLGFKGKALYRTTLQEFEAEKEVFKSLIY